jgi:hypothetical protein
LEFTPDQAKNWPAFEQALRDMAQMRIARSQAREQQAQSPTLTPFERLARRADNMAETSAALKRIADAGIPLYQSLDDAQKVRFKILARMLRPHHHHMHPWNGGDGRGECPSGRTNLWRWHPAGAQRSAYLANRI